MKTMQEVTVWRDGDKITAAMVGIVVEDDNVTPNTDVAWELAAKPLTSVCLKCDGGDMQVSLSGARRLHAALTRLLAELEVA